MPFRLKCNVFHRDEIALHYVLSCPFTTADDQFTQFEGRNESGEGDYTGEVKKGGGGEIKKNNLHKFFFPSENK